MLEIALAMLLGILLGIVAGLLPGLHPNNTIPIILGLSFLFEPLTLAVILISSGVVNCFMNFIPSILLGAPEDSTALGVLPGHKLLLEGHGFEAIKLTVVGCLGGVLFAISTLPIFARVFPVLYKYLRPNIHWLLIGVVGYMISIEKGIKNKLFALTVFLLSGILGLIVLNYSNETLFPLLSGLFGLPMLLLAIHQKTRLPEKFTYEEEKIERKTILSSISVGSLAGIIAGLLPGIGAAQATVLSQQIAGKQEDGRNFLVSIGSVTTSDLVYSLLALFLIGNPRSGIAVAVGQLVNVDFQMILIFISIIIISAGIGCFLTLKLTKHSISFLRKIDYSKLCFYVIAFLCVLIMFFTGPFGLAIAVIATAIGLIPNLVGIRRTHSMGVLILPTIVWFSGISLL